MMLIFTMSVDSLGALQCSYATFDPFDRWSHHVAKNITSNSASPGRVRVLAQPRYLFAGTLWLGLAIFLGSIPILVVLAGGVLLGNYVVMREERTLERQFGEVYLRYRSAVPRWLGKIRR